MSITVKPVTPDFVAEISGLDLAQPLAPADRDVVEATINRYAIVVFHDQKLTDEQQIDFARCFGLLAAPAQKARHTGIKHRIAGNDIADISNLDGAERGVGVPQPVGQPVEPMIAEHSIWHSRGQLAVTMYTEEELKSLPPVPQRVVRRHPGSHRKTLYLAAHASHILGMPVADGRLLLMDLIEHATQRRFVHSHTWKQGDLVIWDNRCTMHRARPFDTTKVRDLRRVTTRDVASTLEQAA